MEHALAITGSLHADDAAVTLPTDLNDFAVFHENGHRALTIRQRAQKVTRCKVVFDVVLHEFRALEFQPFAHFLGEGAALGAEKLKPSHRRAPPALRGPRDKSRPALPEWAECNRRGQSAENRRGRGAEFRRRRSPAALRSAFCACALLRAP